MIISFGLATVYVVNFFGLWYRMIWKKENCEYVIQMGDCFYIRAFFLGFFCLIPLNHVAMNFERFWATIRLSKYEKSNSILGISLIFIMVFVATLIVYLVMLPEDFTEYAPTCLSFSATRIGNNIYFLYISQGIMEISMIVVLQLLVLFNKKRKLDIIDENLSKKFQRNENLAVLQQIGPLIIVTAAVIGAYNGVALLIRPFRDHFTKNQYIIIVFGIFIIPYLPFLLTYFSYRTIQKHLKDREMLAKQAVEIDVIANANFSNDQLLWDTYYIAKYGKKQPKISTVRCWKKYFSNRIENHQ
ncbi:hypothetical protein GCK72_025782 [Caenorhabditis remanei]|uniref:G-protein coupled receptors family 1 profile domain-containing protein n=1 Tax=Caenorhabditis remanei TaxID=31234 RepID=A0A6A5G3M1_CAERE|nr:hypothetical protein GCK72_025782 [Caenorhabditis remanei]KAF1749315.1 hypothetical protein GCK72_025782 [Caenorhabditis remanei]